MGYCRLLAVTKLVKVSDARALAKRRMPTASLVSLACFSVTTVMMFTASVTAGLVFVGMIGAMITISTAQLLRQADRFTSAYHIGIAALLRGDLELAHKAFEPWSAFKRSPRIAASARHSLAWTMMRSGKLEEAKTLFLGSDETFPKAQIALGLFPIAAADTALVYALIGDLDTAESWFAEAEARRSYTHLAAFPAVLVFTRAVIDARKGNLVAAARHLDDHWTQSENVSMGADLRLMRVIRAFARSTAGGPRDAGRAEADLAALRPLAYEREFLMLAVAWPEMATFLASHFTPSRTES